MFAAILVLASACSSGGDDATDTASSIESETETEVDAPTAEDEAEEEEPSSSSAAGDDGDLGITCDEASQAVITLRSSNAFLTATVAGNGEGLELDFDATLAAVEKLRVIQDVDGIFGPPREHLDIIEADLVAASEGRIADMVGDYGWTALNAVVGEEVC